MKITHAIIAVAIYLVVGNSAFADAIKVGISAPFTGDLAEYGRAVRNGFELASRDGLVGSAALVFEDNQYDAHQSISAYRHLKDKHRVDLLFSWGETPLHAIAPIVERERTPTIAMSVDTAPAKDAQWLFLSVNPPRDFVVAVSDNLKKDRKHKIGFVLTDDPYTRGMYEAFRELRAGSEPPVVVASVSPDEKDFRAVALKVAKGGFDAVGVYLLSGQVSQLYRELDRVKFRGTTFGTDVFESPTEIEAAGRAMQGAVYANISVPREFYSRYEATFKSTAQVAFAYNAYVVARWIGDACGKASSRINAEHVMEMLRKGPSDAALQLKSSDQRYPYLNFPIAVKRIVGKGFEEVS